MKSVKVGFTNDQLEYLERTALELTEHTGRHTIKQQVIRTAVDKLRSVDPKSLEVD